MNKLCCKWVLGLIQKQQQTDTHIDHVKAYIVFGSYITPLWPFKRMNSSRISWICWRIAKPAKRRRCTYLHCPYWKNKLSKNISWSFLSFYHSEDVHYARHHGHRWREPDQLSRIGCNHHQCEESASTLGEGQLQCGHSRKHCQRHTSGGESESTLYIQYVQGQQPLLA